MGSTQPKNNKNKNSVDNIIGLMTFVKQLVKRAESSGKTLRWYHWYQKVDFMLVFARFLILCMLNVISKIIYLSIKLEDET